MKNEKNYTKTIAVSGVAMALYIAVMLFTQSFAFGSVQVRIATAIYSLSYIFPFLTVPLGIANGLGNLIGGFGIFDIVGGFFVGIITCTAIMWVKKLKLSEFWVIPILIAGPGLIVPIWLSVILNLPYLPLAASLCLGQVIPAIVGYFLIKIGEKTLGGKK